MAEGEGGGQWPRETLAEEHWFCVSHELLESRKDICLESATVTTMGEVSYHVFIMIDKTIIHLFERIRFNRVHRYQLILIRRDIRCKW